MSTEYAFMGFSYAVNSCERDTFRSQFKADPDTVLGYRTCTGQSAAQLKKEFADIRKTFNGRYVRIYAACDNDGF